jgi:Protein of unknown function (DUF4230)
MEREPGRDTMTRVLTRPSGAVARLVATVVAVVLVIVVGLYAARTVFDWSPFGTEERDRSGPVVLTALRDLSEYHAASGSYQVLIDLEEDTRLVPEFLKGKRTLFLAIGSVDAFVDFGQLDADAVTVSEDRRTVTLRLPRAQLARPVIDTKESRVLDRDLGVLDRLGSLVSDNPDEDRRLYVLAEEKLAEAATKSELVGRAETNTRSTLERLLTALGFTTVRISYVDATPGG